MKNCLSKGIILVGLLYIFNEINKDVKKGKKLMNIVKSKQILPVFILLFSFYYINNKRTFEGFSIPVIDPDNPTTKGLLYSPISGGPHAGTVAADFYGTGDAAIEPDYRTVFKVTDVNGRVIIFGDPNDLSNHVRFDMDPSTINSGNPNSGATISSTAGNPKTLKIDTEEDLLGINAAADGNISVNDFQAGTMGDINADPSAATAIPAYFATPGGGGGNTNGVSPDTKLNFISAIQSLDASWNSVGDALHPIFDGSTMPDENNNYGGSLSEGDSVMINFLSRQNDGSSFYISKLGATDKTTSGPTKARMQSYFSDDSFGAGFSIGDTTQLKDAIFCVDPDKDPTLQSTSSQVNPLDLGIVKVGAGITSGFISSTLKFIYGEPQTLFTCEIPDDAATGGAGATCADWEGSGDPFPCARDVTDGNVEPTLKEGAPGLLCSDNTGGDPTPGACDVEYCCETRCPRSNYQTNDAGIDTAVAIDENQKLKNLCDPESIGESYPLQPVYTDIINGTRAGVDEVRPCSSATCLKDECCTTESPTCGNTGTGEGFDWWYKQYGGLGPVDPAITNLEEYCKHNQHTYESNKEGNSIRIPWNRENTNMSRDAAPTATKECCGSFQPVNPGGFGEIRNKVDLFYRTGKIELIDNLYKSFFLDPGFTSIGLTPGMRALRTKPWLIFLIVWYLFSPYHLIDYSFGTFSLARDDDKGIYKRSYYDGLAYTEEHENTGGKSIFDKLHKKDQSGEFVPLDTAASDASAMHPVDWYRKLDDGTRYYQTEEAKDSFQVYDYINWLTSWSFSNNSNERKGEYEYVFGGNKGGVRYSFDHINDDTLRKTSEGELIIAIQKGKLPSTSELDNGLLGGYYYDDNTIYHIKFTSDNGTSYYPAIYGYDHSKVTYVSPGMIKYWRLKGRKYGKPGLGGDGGGGVGIYEIQTTERSRESFFNLPTDPPNLRPVPGESDPDKENRERQRRYPTSAKCLKSFYRNEKESWPEFNETLGELHKIDVNDQNYNEYEKKRVKGIYQEIIEISSREVDGILSDDEAGLADIKRRDELLLLYNIYYPCKDIDTNKGNFIFFRFLTFVFTYYLRLIIFFVCLKFTANLGRQFWGSVIPRAAPGNMIMSFLVGIARGYFLLFDTFNTIINRLTGRRQIIVIFILSLILPVINVIGLAFNYFGINDSIV